MAVPTNPKERRIKTNSHLEWGKLVKTWATGKNYVNSMPVSNFPKPSSFQEFVTQCQLAGVHLTYDDHPGTAVEINDNINLILIQHDVNTLVIRLSPKEFLEKSEGDVVNNNNNYVLSSYYNTVLVNATPKIEHVDTPEKRLNLHAMRVGEYTIAMCM